MDIVPDIKKGNLSKQQIEVLSEQERHSKYIGSMKVVPGHTMFSFNRDTKEIKKSVYVDKVAVGFNGKAITTKELTVEANCYYEQALNRKNFVKRLIRGGLANDIADINGSF